MNKLTFEDHKKILNKILNLDEKVKIIVVNDKVENLNEYEQFYKEKYNISLTELLIKSDKSNGMFLWHIDEVVFLRNEEMIGTLAHEMRHAWQYKNRKKKKFKIKLNIITKKDNIFKKMLKSIHYTFFSRVELDANKFAFHYCKLNGFKKDAVKYWKKSYGIYAIYGILLIGILVLVFS